MPIRPARSCVRSFVRRPDTLTDRQGILRGCLLPTAIDTSTDPSTHSALTDLEVAVGVEEEVGRLEVAVQHVGRVHVLEGAEDLIIGYNVGRDGRVRERERG